MTLRRLNEIFESFEYAEGKTCYMLPNPAMGFPLPITIYFFVAAASSALALALFSLTPTNRASLRASLNFL